MIFVFVTWLRHFFEIDERRLRVRLYLHADLDLDAAIAFWCELTGDPGGAVPQAVPGSRRCDDASNEARRSAALRSSTAALTIHRRVMGMIEALLSTTALPG